MADDAVNLTPRETTLLARRLIAQHVINDTPSIVLWEDVPELSERAFELLTETIEREGRSMLLTVDRFNHDASEIERRARG